MNTMPFLLILVKLAGLLGTSITKLIQEYIAGYMIHETLAILMVSHTNLDTEIPFKIISLIVVILCYKE